MATSLFVAHKFTIENHVDSQMSTIGGLSIKIKVSL